MEGHAFIRGQILKLSRNGAVFKRASMLNGETKHVDWGSQAPWLPLGTGPVASAKTRSKISIKWTLRAGNSVGTDRIAFLIDNC